MLIGLDITKGQKSIEEYNNTIIFLYSLYESSKNNKNVNRRLPYGTTGPDAGAGPIEFNGIQLNTNYF